MHERRSFAVYAAQDDRLARKRRSPSSIFDSGIAPPFEMDVQLHEI